MDELHYYIYEHPATANCSIHYGDTSSQSSAAHCAVYLTIIYYACYPHVQIIVVSSDIQCTEYTY